MLRGPIGLAIDLILALAGGLGDRIRKMVGHHDGLPWRERFPGNLRRPMEPVLNLIRVARSYQFRDCRLLLEQDGNVHYLVLTASLQRRVARFAVVTLGAGLALLLLMAAMNTALSSAKSRLERSHEEIYRALIDANGKEQGVDGSFSEEQMLAIASSIRKRDNDIRRFVDRSLVSITDENQQLNEALHASGLTEKAIRAIQLSSPAGGGIEALSTDVNFAQVNALARVVSSNRSLRDVLEELPDHLPLNSPSVSSVYGLRESPITGRPQFHTGVDLLPSVDLLIHPAKRGQIALASYGQELGNVVIVRHGGGIETLYGHMASIAVREGDEVTERSVLGIVGNTGTASTGRHLHFEVIVGGYPVDPLKVIQTAQNVRKIENQH